VEEATEDRKYLKWIAKKTLNYRGLEEIGILGEIFFVIATQEGYA